MDLAHGTVTWTYTMTADDVKLGLRAGQRVGHAQWLHRWGVRVAGVIGLVCMVSYELLLLSGVVTLSWRPVAYVVVFVAALVIIHRSQLRAYRRLAALNGKIVASIDANGLRTTNERGMTISNWSGYHGYVETPAAFVLLTSSGRPTVVTVLPKRGLEDANDVDRARMIISEHVRTAPR